MPWLTQGDVRPIGWTGLAEEVQPAWGSSAGPSPDGRRQPECHDQSSNVKFNYDFHVSFTEKEVESGKLDYNYTNQPFGSTEAPGISVFRQTADGPVYHTYSVHGRGLELLMGTYRILDLTPKGRDEDQFESSMECEAAKHD